MSYVLQDPCDHFFSQANLQCLVDYGHLILENALPASLITMLGRQSLDMRSEGLFQTAGISRGKDHHVAALTRSDIICWWDPLSVVRIQQAFWHFIQGLRLQLNRHLFLGLHDAELHYAIYPCGAFYGKHLDRFRSSNLRKISLVLFLNETWAEEDGGHLRLYDDDGRSYRDVLPKGGVLVLFFSDRVLHEVRPTNRERLSLTGWFRTRP